ncbi:MAG: hypothetical protein Q4B43_05365 [Bacteroidota bacterium]|nr:hypothetical protein [Bacteroidota bacterium]
MILTEKHFEQIRDNIEFEYDVFTGIFNIKALTPFFKFNAHYHESDIVKNQFVISPLKMDITIESDIIPEDVELSGVQKKEVAGWLKYLYEETYLPAKEEYQDAPLIGWKEVNDFEKRNSFWLYN